MGRPDQLAKRIMREETGAATGNRVTFKVPSEVPVGALSPDGVVRVVAVPAVVGDLPAPWSRLVGEAVLDVTMPRDHVDRAALARTVLRREARWVQHLEKEPPDPLGQDPTLDAPDPRAFAAWVVAPHAPQWLRADADRGAGLFEALAPGCWRVAAYPYDVLWIAANELPLRVELLPFLVARSGRALVDFAKWALGVKGPEWLANVVQELPMGERILDELADLPRDDEEQRQFLVRHFQKLVQKLPDAANDLRQEGSERTLAHQFERKLRRTLSMAERAELVRRLDNLGPDRLGDLVLDLDAPALAAWLADPRAT